MEDEMKPEINLTNEEIENFSINVVDRYEGCADATIFLKQIYGENTDNLRKRKKDFITLIKMGKSAWLINFLLNIITKPYRVKFACGVISDHLSLLSDAPTQIRLVETLGRLQLYSEKKDQPSYNQLVQDFEYLLEKRNKIKQEIEDMGGEKGFKVNETKFNQLLSESQFLKGILSILIEVDGNMTRSVVKFIESLGEAIQWNKMLTEHRDHNKETLERIGLMLTDYIDIWEE